MGYVIVIIIVLVMFLLYRFRDRVEKSMPWLWRNVAQPIFNYFFVISVRKVTIVYYTTIAGICVAFPAIQFALDKDHNIEAAITFNGSGFDWAAVIITALLTIGYALYIFFETNNHREEAFGALITLGFSKAAVEKVLNTILKKEPGCTSEEIIKKALKLL